ncbi:fatty acid desaturase [Chryseolinea sp. T2]|uniref:fatty acid desaturase family protein n=1 Tax=Chryseolinea sp. T2 TaxID=3129255 RepID=UPI0030768CF9
MNSKGDLIFKTMPFAKEDRLLSWYYLLSTLILAAIAFSLTSILNNTFLKLVSGIIAGLITARLVVIYHDFHHGAILKGSKIAHLIMTTVGLVTLTPSSIWDESHEHHHHTNSKFATFVLGSFPTISTSMYRRLTSKEQFRYKLLRHPLMIVFGYIPIYLVSFCLWPFFENPKRYWDCGVAALIHIALASALWYYGGLPALTFSLLIPSFVAFSLGGYIFYAQHNFPEVVLSSDDSWNYFDAALKSSSYIKMSRMMRWFTANIGYHHIHHVNPRIPFYNLPQAMRSVIEFQHPRCTSLHPNEIWRCLQLKLWDEDKERMISMREFRSGVYR